MSPPPPDGHQEKLFKTYDADLKGEEPAQMSACEAVTKMPYDFSPARIRCMELAAELLGQDHSADS
ncbi:hypothetical protein [Streptomyces sp. NPDC001500]